MNELILESEVEVSVLGKISLRDGKFERTFSAVIAEDATPRVVREMFIEMANHISISLREYDERQRGEESIMLWKHCATCKQDFETASGVCPNHTGHILTVIEPQPASKAPKAPSAEKLFLPNETPPVEPPDGSIKVNVPVPESRLVRGLTGEAAEIVEPVGAVPVVEEPTVWDEALETASAPEGEKSPKEGI